MAGRELVAMRTVVAAADVGRALVFAWRAQLGREPSRESLCLLLAQSAHETGRWKSCHAWNLGNAKATKSWGGDYCFFACNEILSAREASRVMMAARPRTDGVRGLDAEVRRMGDDTAEVWFYPSNPAARFRAFHTLEDGAADALALLHRRFSRAWPALEQGDARAFVAELKAARYFTADEGPYAAGVASLQREFLRTLPELAPPSTPPSVAAPVALGWAVDALREHYRPTRPPPDDEG